MVQISRKFIADLKAFSDLDIVLKEFNSLAGTKKIDQIKVSKPSKKRVTKKSQKRTNKEQKVKTG